MPIREETSQEAVEIFKERFSAMDEHRRSIEEKLRRVDENFRMIPKSRTYRESKFSDLRSPLTISQVLGIASHNFLSVFGSERWVAVERSPGIDEITARTMEGLVNNDLRKIVASEVKFLAYETSKVKDGYCPWKLIPIGGGRPFRGWDFIPIERNNFWWDPLAGLVLQDARDVIYRVYRDKEYLSFMGEVHEKWGDGYGYDSEAVGKVLEKMEGRKTEDPRTKDRTTTGLRYPLHKNVIPIYEHWRERDLQVLAEVGTEKILLRPREWGNPLRTEASWGMGFPFGLGVDMPLVGEVSGIGVGELLMMLQEDKDTKYNQNNDLVNRILNQQVKVRGIPNKKTLMELTNPSPNGILFVDETEDIEPFQINPAGVQVGWQIMSFLDQQADEATGFFPQIEGGPGVRGTTATEYMGSRGAAMPRHTIRVILDGATTLRPLAEMILWMSREFRTEGEVVHIVGQDGQEWDERIMPEDIDPTVGLIAMPDVSVEPKIVTQQNLLKFAQLVFPLAGTGQLDVSELIQVIGEEMKIPRLHRIWRQNAGLNAMMGQPGSVSQEGQMTGAGPEADIMAKIMSGLSPTQGQEGSGGGRPPGKINGGFGG